MRRLIAIAVGAVAVIGFALPAHAQPSVAFDDGMNGSIVRSTPFIGTQCVPDPTTLDPTQIDPNDPVNSTRNALSSMGNLTCQDPPANADGHVDGTASSDVGLQSVELFFDPSQACTPDQSQCVDNPAPTASDVIAALDCTDNTNTSCTWSVNLSFPLVPGPYQVTAQATDLNGDQSVATITITVV
jgi:hypothetical protein